MLSDTESQLSDLRRQQGYLNEYLQRMRQAATEVDLEITSVHPPRLGEVKPLAAGSSGSESPAPEEVPVMVKVDREES
jgi:hypothetical protein